MKNNLLVGGIFVTCKRHSTVLTIKFEKPEFYGVEGKFKAPIESYLTGRCQKVALDNITDNSNSSKWELIKCGVPQGLILGPLFFPIYINDLPTLINKDNNMVLFADDIGIIIFLFSSVWLHSTMGFVS